MEKFYNDKNKKNVIITSIIFCVLISAAAVYSCFFSEEYDAGSDRDIVAETNGEIPMTDIDELENVVESGPLPGNKKKSDDEESDDFSFTINNSITLKNAADLADVKIENPASNKYNFYVEIKIQDEIIYKSPVLEPDTHITSDYLIKKLDKGSHDAVATIYVTNPDSDKILAENSLDVKIKIKK